MGPGAPRSPAVAALRAATCAHLRRRQGLQLRGGRRHRAIRRDQAAVRAVRVSVDSRRDQAVVRAVCVSVVGRGQGRWVEVRVGFAGRGSVLGRWIGVGRKQWWREGRWSRDLQFTTWWQGVVAEGV